MSEHQDEIDRLEGEIEERRGRVRDLKARPMGTAEARRLAKESPHEFNQRFEACQRAGRSPFKADEKE